MLTSQAYIWMSANMADMECQGYMNIMNMYTLPWNPEQSHDDKCYDMTVELVLLEMALK